MKNLTRRWLGILRLRLRMTFFILWIFAVTSDEGKIKSFGFIPFCAEDDNRVVPAQ